MAHPSHEVNHATDSLYFPRLTDARPRTGRQRRTTAPPGYRAAAAEGDPGGFRALGKRRLRVTGAAAPDIWHDFYGFPPPLYAVRYPAKGAPALAQRTIELLQAAGLPAQADPQRPFDHGTWVPLSLMYPQADIPVLQLSLPSRLGPALQSRVGQALRQLRGEGVLLIGSGSITHNLGELDWHAGPEAIAPWAREFRDWMVEKLQADDEAALHDYRRQAPWAARNHPSDEHLLPLFCAARAAAGCASSTAALPWARWGWISIASIDRASRGTGGEHWLPAASWVDSAGSQEIASDIVL